MHLKTADALIVFFLIISTRIQGQVYLEGEKNRYRFAQTAVGVDLRTSLTGGSFYTYNSTNLIKNSFEKDLTPVLTIAGTHFWGHVEFFTGLALTNFKITDADAKYYFKRNAGTGVKIYPFKLKYRKIVPYIGTSFSSFTFKAEEGTKLTRMEYPLQMGLSFISKLGLFEVGANYFFNRNFNYYLRDEMMVPLAVPGFNFSLKYKYIVDFTILTEKRVAKGEVQRNYENLLKIGGMNSLFISSGFTNSYVLGKSSYNQSRPYMDDYTISNIIPEFSFGYHHHPLNINFSLEYRRFRFGLEAFREAQTIIRKSLNMGASKYLGDYHGFNPFIGASISLENMRFREKKEGIETLSLRRKFITYGFNFGWDIKPSNVDWWTIRSNVRYFPDLEIHPVSGKRAVIDQIEVNFFQFVFLINRFHSLSKTE